MSLREQQLNQAFVELLKDETRPAARDAGAEFIRRQMRKEPHPFSIQKLVEVMTMPESEYQTKKARRRLVLPPGTRVRRGARDDPEAEYGVVVASWLDMDGDADCWVAFHGTSEPEGDDWQHTKPYVLRYFSVSLTVLSGGLQ